MLTTLQAAARRGATIVAINPLPRGRRCTRFAHPQHPLEAARPRHADRARRTCAGARSAATVALLKGVMKALLERGCARPRARASTTTFVARHAEGFDGVRGRAAPPSRGSCWLRERDRAETRCARRRRCCAGDAQDHRVLGDGSDAAQARGREHPGDRQPAADARHARPAGRGPVPGARTLATCRAIARWASIIVRGRRFSTRSRAVFGFAPPRAHGLDTVGTIEGMLSRPGAAAVRAGRQLPVRRARHRGDGARAARLRADRSRRDEAQPQRTSYADARRCCCPAWAAARATCRRAAPSSSPSRIRWARCTRSQGVLRPAGDAAAQRAGDRRAGSHRRCWANARACGGRGWSRTTTGSATTSPHVIPGFEDFNARVREAGRLRAAEPGARAAVPDRRAGAPASPFTPSPRTGSRPGSCC